EILNVSVNDFLKMSECAQQRFKLRKALIAATSNSNRNALITGIKSVEPLGGAEYFGFPLSGDHLYLTDDYFIHHNSGKSCTIQFVMKDVVKLGGIVIIFNHPQLFIMGMRLLRQIQPEVPVIVVMEDIDAILEDYSESEVLNILDGVNDVTNTIFLATTNYPEKLGPRIVNRPSRFDKRFKIGYPNEEARRIYLKKLLPSEAIHNNVDIEQWISDTEGFSIAHLKEL